MSAEAFSVLDRAPSWQQQLGAHVPPPPPPVELMEWPDPLPALPLILDRMPAEREGLLRAQTPSPTASSWET